MLFNALLSCKPLILSATPGPQITCHNISKGQWVESSLGRVNVYFYNMRIYLHFRWIKSLQNNFSDLGMLLLFKKHMHFPHLYLDYVDLRFIQQTLIRKAAIRRMEAKLRVRWAQPEGRSVPWLYVPCTCSFMHKWWQDGLFVSTEEKSRNKHL